MEKGDIVILRDCIKASDFNLLNTFEVIEVHFIDGFFIIEHMSEYAGYLSGLSYTRNFIKVGTVL